MSSLDATILCIDNSDWTRNGDYVPNRFNAQISAANFIIENKCEQNPENCLGTRLDVKYSFKW